MSWIETRAGLQMAQVIIRYLPRITVCLEEIVNRTEIIKVGGNNEMERNELETEESS